MQRAKKPINPFNAQNNLQEPTTKNQTDMYLHRKYCKISAYIFLLRKPYFRIEASTINNTYSGLSSATEKKKTYTLPLPLPKKRIYTLIFVL